MLVGEPLRTARLLLRSWRAEDAPLLQPVLAANQSHIAPWIPRRVSDPATLEELAQRLESFRASFAAAHEWRFGIFALDESEVLGEVDLLPRDADARVPYARCDRAEIGYWLRADRTGEGLATEAATAMLDAAAALSSIGHLEIRCDARNVASAAVPRRLGFALASTVSDASVIPGEEPVTMQIWTRALRRLCTPE